MTLCCAENCPNRSGNGVCFPKVLKKIPKNEELRAKWIHQINRPNYKFGVNSYVCEFHFAPDQWENRDARQLKKGAVPTLFCFCSRNRLPLKLCENLIHDHRYSSSPFSSSRESSPITARTVSQLDHLYCDEKENQKHSSRKRGRPSKGSRVDHEHFCPMKLRVIDHDYTMLLPIHNNRHEEFISTVHRNSGVLQESLPLENRRNVNILVKESTFPSKSSFIEPLSSAVSMDFSILGKHSLGTIEISCSASDLEKRGNFNKSDKNCDDVNKLKNEVIKLKREKDVLAVQLFRLQKKCDIFIKRFGRRLGQDRLDALTRGSKAKRIKWTDKTILGGLKLHFASSTTGYELTSKIQMPLPSVRILQQRLQHVRFKAEILQKIFSKFPTKIHNMNS